MMVMNENISALQFMIASLLGSALTLYMLLILLRWTAPFLELELHGRWLAWIPKLTDPLIELMRRLLPPMGPMDWGPIAAVVAVWIVRLIILGQ